jgi:hypothetical protein
VSEDKILTAIEKFSARNESQHEKILETIKNMSIEQARLGIRLDTVENVIEEHTGDIKELKSLSGKVKVIWTGVGVVITAIIGVVVAWFKGIFSGSAS